MRSVRNAVVLLAIAAVSLAGAAPANAASGDESWLTRTVNQERSSRGLAALAVRSDLTDIARRHSAEMARRGRIYHSDDIGGDVPGCWEVVGENVGVGPSVADVHEALMASSGHRENVLLPDFNEIGVGIVAGDDGSVYVTQTFAERRCGRAKTTASSSKASAKPSARPKAPAPPAAKPAPAPTAPAPAPASAPAPAADPPPVAPVSAEQTVELLGRMIDLDAGLL